MSQGYEKLGEIVDRMKKGSSIPKVTVSEPVAFEATTRAGDTTSVELPAGTQVWVLRGKGNAYDYGCVYAVVGRAQLRLLLAYDEMRRVVGVRLHSKEFGANGCRARHSRAISLSNG